MKISKKNKTGTIGLLILKKAKVKKKNQLQAKFKGPSDRK